MPFLCTKLHPPHLNSCAKDSIASIPPTNHGLSILRLLLPPPPPLLSNAFFNQSTGHRFCSTNRSEDAGYEETKAEPFQILLARRRQRPRPHFNRCREATAEHNNSLRPDEYDR